MIETLLFLLLWLIVIGVIFYLLLNYVLPALPLDPPIKAAIIAILAIIVVILLLSYVVPLPHRL